MSDWLEFLSHNWLVLILLILLFVFLVSGLKFLFSLTIIAAVVLIFLFDYSPAQVIDMAKNAYNKVYSMYEDDLKPKLDAELANAVTEKNPDGSFTIKTESFLIYGVEGGNNVTIQFGETSFNLNLEQLGSEIHSKITNLQTNVNSVPTN